VIITFFVSARGLVASQTVLSIVETSTALTADTVPVKFLIIGPYPDVFHGIREASVGCFSASPVGLVSNVRDDHDRDSTKRTDDTNDSVLSNVVSVRGASGGAASAGRRTRYRVQFQTGVNTSCERRSDWAILGCVES